VARMTPAQWSVAKRLSQVYTFVTIYSVDRIDGAVLMWAKGPADEFALTIVEHDGGYENVTDPLNQSHWLEDIRAGRFPVEATI